MPIAVHHAESRSVRCRIAIVRGIDRTDTNDTSYDNDREHEPSQQSLIIIQAYENHVEIDQRNF